MNNEPTDEDRKRAREWKWRRTASTPDALDALTLFVADIRVATAEAIAKEIEATSIAGTRLLSGDTAASNAIRHCAAIARRHGRGT